MTTYSAITTLPDLDQAMALSEAMERMEPEPYGVCVLEIEDGSGLFEIGGYFIDRPDESELALAATAFGAKPFVLSEIGEKDWVSEVQRELSPVRAGRFLVYGSHDREVAKDAHYALEIEAAMAFGTGHHGTTRGCLLALDQLATEGFYPQRIADIGAGTGVLAMAAAKLWKRRCIATDIDPVAVATLKANARANDLTPWITAVQAVGFTSPVIRENGPYDLIFANILAGPLKKLAPSMRANCAYGGVIVLSGILNEQLAGVEAVYRSHGFSRIRLGQDKDWSTITMAG